jgi:site-specific DNA recombinase
MTSNGTRAAIYVRVSSKPQANDGKASLPAQEASARELAAERTPPLEVVRVYAEPGYSGTKYNRPAMDQVRRDAHAGLFDWLIMDFGDRFTRGGIAHYGRFLSEFDEAGVRVYLVYERLDLSDPQQRMMGAFIAHQAEEDNRKRTERRRRTYEAYALQGHYVCGKRPPYGFRFPPDERRPDGRLKKGRIVPDPVTGEVMRRLFRSHAAGATLASLKTVLEREHILTPMGKALWDVAVISKLLRNPIYWGDGSVTLKGKRIPYPPGVVEPLIDRETALAVQARLSQNRRYSPRTLNTRHYTVLSGGRGRCAFCGHALSPHHENANRRAGSPPYITYRCGFATKHYNECAAPRVRADLADQLVWDTLRDLLLTPDKLADLAAQQAQAELHDDPASDLARLRRTLTEAMRKRDNLYAAVAEADSKEVRAGLLVQLEFGRNGIDNAPGRSGRVGTALDGLRSPAADAG